MAEAPAPQAQQNHAEQAEREYQHAVLPALGAHVPATLRQDHQQEEIVMLAEYKQQQQLAIQIRARGTSHGPLARDIM